MHRFLFVCSLVLTGIVPAHGAPGVGQTTVFTRVGEPGSPEGIAVHDGIVYVGTQAPVRGNGGGPPSRIFRYSLADGSLIGSWPIDGQVVSGTHGLLGMTFGPDGMLYVLDRNPGRVLRFDVATGQQSVYATVPDLPTCRAVIGPATACAPTTLDEPTFLDYLAFDGAGNLYITDLQAATIFRVPACTQAPCGTEIWYQDPAFDGIFGLNGIALSLDGEDLYFAMTGSQQPGDATRGVIYTLPVTDSPAPEDLKVFHTFGPVDGPDGIAFGAEGDLYVALAGANQVAVLDPAGNETVRFPDPVQNQLQEIPYDLPASIAFDGSGSILVTNQAFFTGNAEHWAVLRAWVDDVGP